MTVNINADKLKYGDNMLSFLYNDSIQWDQTLKQLKYTHGVYNKRNYGQ